MERITPDMRYVRRILGELLAIILNKGDPAAIFWITGCIDNTLQDSLAWIICRMGLAGKNYLYWLPAVCKKFFEPLQII